MQRLKTSITQTNTKKLLNSLHEVEKNIQNIQNIFTSSRKQEEEKAIAAIKENPKFFYKYAAKHNKTKSNVGPLINKEGQSIHDPKEIADKLKLQYESVFSIPDPDKRSKMPRYSFKI